MKLFTKLVFKIAMGCPTRLYYEYDRDRYANQNAENEFLMALAKGGFQVGALAKLYYGVDADLEELKGYDEPLARTAELLKRESVTIAEAAFKFGKCFVRADILRKTPTGIDLIEVKAKSWETGAAFEKEVTKGPNKGRMKIESGIRDYVYDVAFQKYVVVQALKESGISLPVRAYLMMADKSIECDAEQVNQYFKLKTREIDKGRKETRVEVLPGAEILLKKHRVLTAFDVDSLCDRIIAGEVCDQKETLHGRLFLDFVKEMSELFCSHVRKFSPLSTACYQCPYYSDAHSDKADGYDECWQHGLPGYDPTRPLLEELRGNKKVPFSNNVRYLSDVSRANLRSDPLKPPKDDPLRLTSEDRRILQVALCTHQPDLLGELAEDVRDGVYLDIEGLKREMSSWKFPLHMIDFETTTVALPFYSHMRPYEQIAFQFSHHVIEKTADGGYRIRHAGQYLNTEKGFFPNFDFIRELKRQLEGDEGTIFRYAAHENTVLRQIRDQLENYPKEILDRYGVTDAEKVELVAFIDSITSVKDGHKGRRDMVDLCKVVTDYYYDPYMKGSVSIKQVLPSVLNGSAFLQEKYSKPIYGGGAEIESQNIISPSEQPTVWIQPKADGSGEVENPYKWLPDVKEYLPEGFLALEGEDEDNELTQVNNGGAALTAYSKLQFTDLQMTEALRKSLLRYCELDTLAMVFIWEYFNERVAALSR